MVSGCTLLIEAHFHGATPPSWHGHTLPDLSFLFLTARHRVLYPLNIAFLILLFWIVKIYNKPFNFLKITNNWREGVN